ncbi:MAG: hypothetical protein KC900_02200 [Candidatus Omnitrophica bacterium]|nr:hypothetical protein [Candidatus Omnitrophota bacterium]
MLYSHLFQSKAGNVGMLMLRGLNCVLLAGLCAALLYAAQLYRGALGESQGEPIDVSVPARSGKPVNPTLKSAQPLAAYLTDLTKRDLFEAPWEKQSEVPEQPPDDFEGAKSVMEFTQSVRLVGIIRDENPKAVVEDLINRETLFVSLGDEIKGAILSDIFEDKVIFRIGDEVIEMYP